MRPKTGRCPIVVCANDAVRLEHTGTFLPSTFAFWDDAHFQRQTVPPLSQDTLLRLFQVDPPSDMGCGPGHLVGTPCEWTLALFGGL